MANDIPDITQFDRMVATDRQFASLCALRNTHLAEATPDDPPNTVENFKNEMQNIPPVFEFHGWAAWVDDTAVGFATLGIPHMDTNQHVAQFDIAILPEYRRRGLGTAFLRHITDVAQREGRSLLVANTHSTVEAGVKFMKALGANVGLSLRRNDLIVADVDRDMLQSWIKQAPERAAGFEIVEFAGVYPQDKLPKIAEMYRAGNEAPRDSLEVDDFNFTPEQLKQLDEAMVAVGGNRWSLVAVEKSTGNYAGWTDLSFNPTRPTVADVGGTAVVNEYRNLGLGRWLKAAILDKLIREKPEVLKVRTGNAHSNAPMLKINDELGFKPALTNDLWQVETDKARTFVEERQGALTV